MPALPTIANTFRVALLWQSANGQTAVNVMHIHTNTSGKVPLDVMENLDDNAGSNLWLSVSSTAVVKEIQITPLDGVSATVGFAPATPASWTGGQSGDFSPATAVLVKLTTAHRGRTARGRLFLPYTGESAMSDGNLDSGIQSSMQTEWTAFNGAIASDADTPMSIVVASYKLATIENVTSFFVEPVLATQRRRQGRLRSA